MFGPAAPGLHFTDVCQGTLIVWIFQVVVNNGLHLVLIILGSDDCGDDSRAVHLRGVHLHLEVGVLALLAIFFPYVEVDECGLCYRIYGAAYLLEAWRLLTVDSFHKEIHLVGMVS